MEIENTQEYSLTNVDSASSLDYELITSQEKSESNSSAITLSTRESSSELSIGEQYERVNPVPNTTADTAQDSFVLVEALDENDSPNNTVAYINEIAVNTSDDKANREVRPEDQKIPSTDEVIHHYPHMIVKLCDGEIINAESGARIINLSQFMVSHNLDVISPIELDHQSQQSQHLVINEDYLLQVAGNVTDHLGNQVNQYEIDNQPPSQTLTQLNQSLVDHEETVIATSEPSSQAFEPSRTSLEIPPEYQQSVLYNETDTQLDVSNLELQVTWEIY